MCLTFPHCSHYFTAGIKPVTFEMAGTHARGRSTHATGAVDVDAAYNPTLEEDLKVWPEGDLPPSKVTLKKPDFDGADAFNMMKEALYAKAGSKDGGSTVKFDLRVQDGEIGYYCDRFVLHFRFSIIMALLGGIS